MTEKWTYKMWSAKMWICEIGYV